MLVWAFDEGMLNDDWFWVLFDYDDNHMKLRHALFAHVYDKTDCCVMQMFLCTVDYGKLCVMVYHYALFCVMWPVVSIDLKVGFNVEWSFIIEYLLSLDYQMGAFES